MTIDLSKPPQTRRGEKAELVYDGISGDWPLVVVVHCDDERKILRTYTREGVLFNDEDNMSNLMNVPVKHTREVWLNVYPGNIGIVVHETREIADEYTSSKRIACIPITIEFEEGEGL